LPVPLRLLTVNSPAETAMLEARVMETGGKTSSFTRTISTVEGSVLTEDQVILFVALSSQVTLPGEVTWRAKAVEAQSALRSKEYCILMEKLRCR